MNCQRRSSWNAKNAALTTRKFLSKNHIHGAHRQTQRRPMTSKPAMTTNAKAVRTAGAKAIENAGCVLRQKDGRNFSIITSEIRSSRRVVLIEHVMRKVIRSRAILFKVRKAPWPQHGEVLCSTSLGKALITAVQSDYTEIRRMFPMHVLHPLVELLEKYLAENGLSGLTPARKFEAKDVDWLNQSVSDLRARAKTSSFIRKRDEIAKAVQRRINAQRKYFDALLQENECSYVIKLRLGYAHDALSVASAPADAVSAQTLARHRSDFLRLTQIFSSMKRVGYVWKVDHNRLNSYSIDVLLFYRVGLLGILPETVQHIGKCWVECVTSGHGTFYNFNAVSNTRFGHVSRTDSSAIDYLNNSVALDLVCADYYVKLNAPNQHTFDKGNMPKVKRGRGRPRKKLAATGPQSAWLAPARLQNMNAASMI